MKKATNNNKIIVCFNVINIFELYEIRGFHVEPYLLCSLQGTGPCPNGNNHRPFRLNFCLPQGLKFYKKILTGFHKYKECEVRQLRQVATV